MKILKKLHLLFFTILLFVVSSCDSSVTEKENRPEQVFNAKIIVASDVHVFDNALLEKPGNAFDEVLNSDRKLLVQSEKITDKLIEDVLKEKPSLFMICGDLTKDGELSSHNMLAQKLRKVHQAGIKVLVVPGNHDINNPHAFKFNGDMATPTDRVGPEKFREIYKDFGYDPAQTIEQGPELCYLAEPVPGLWVLGIDGCIYKDNITENYPRTGGALDAVRIKWIVEKTKEGKAKGKRIVGMMHHGIVEHFPMQGTVAADYLIADHDNVARQLAEGGLEFMFTGHFHAQDIVKKEYPGGTLYDIQTGSTVTYPCPYRVITLDENKIEIKSQRLKLKSDITNNIELEEFAYEHIKTGMPGLINYLLKELQSKLQISDAMMGIIKQMIPQFSPMLLEIYVNHLKGDENGLSSNPGDPENPGSLQLLNALKELVNGMVPQYAPYLNMIDPILYDTAPKDNEMVITFAKK